MKKLYFKFRDFFTGSNLVKYGQIAYMVTEKVLQAGESDTATTILYSLSLNDEYAKIKVVLEKMLPEFKSVQTKEGQLGIVKRMAMEIMKALDGNASGRMGKYSDLFEELIKGK